MSISEHHQQEINRFLKFFRSRLKNHLENVEADFEDTRSDRLSSDDVYSQNDVKEVIDSLCHAVKANVRSELQDTINMMALVLRQVLGEAEAHKMSVDLDISSVEDRELLDQVERLSVAEWIHDAGRGDNKGKALAQARRSAMEQERMSKEREEIRSAVTTKEKELSMQHGKELRRVQEELDEARVTIRDLERHLKDAQQHVSQTTQFQNLKRMVAQKNDQLQLLRQRLRRYEPDADDEAKDADDDSD